MIFEMKGEEIFYLLIIFIVGEFILERVLERLNTSSMKSTLPKELNGIYDEKEYSRFQSYKRVCGKAGLISSTISFTAVLAMFLFGGFAYVDGLVRGFVESETMVTVIFFGLLMLGSGIISLPIEIYSIFSIEEHYGFNKMTRKIFILDKIKGALLGAVLGGGLLSLIVWIFQNYSDSFWYLTWGVITLFSILMTLFYSNLIVPLFNKQEPLEEGELRDAIESFGKRVGFDITNIFVIDGSKRSSKANAYFTGFGSKKRIVLYDTLIDELEVEEVVAVLAHEIGHYKKRHTISGMITSIITTGATLFLLSLIINSDSIYSALGVAERGFHIGLLVFSILLSPVNLILGVLMNIWSRFNEYQADRFAVENYGSAPLISGLKKISVKALSNLTPHPAYEFVYYSHPSLLKRVKAML